VAGLLVALAGVTASPTFAHTIGRLQHFLGRVDAAEESFRLALELHEELRSPLYVSSTLAAWAELLAERADV